MVDRDAGVDQGRLDVKSGRILICLAGILFCTEKTMRGASVVIGRFSVGTGVPRTKLIFASQESSCHSGMKFLLFL